MGNFFVFILAIIFLVGIFFIGLSIFKRLSGTRNFNNPNSNSKGLLGYFKESNLFSTVYGYCYNWSSIISSRIIPRLEPYIPYILIFLIIIIYFILPIFSIEFILTKPPEYTQMLINEWM